MRGNQARVKNADVRRLSSTVVMHRRKSASRVHNVLGAKHILHVSRIRVNYFIVIHRAKGKKLKVCVQSREVKCIRVVR